MREREKRVKMQEERDFVKTRGGRAGGEGKFGEKRKMWEF